MISFTVFGVFCFVKKSFSGSISTKDFGISKKWCQFLQKTYIKKRKKKLQIPYLCTSLFVCVLMLHAMDLQAMWLQGAALRERFLAQIALVRPNASVRPGVSLQIKGIVESFAAEGAQVAFDIWMTLHVSIQESLKGECLRAYSAHELIVIVHRGRFWGRSRFFIIIANAMAVHIVNG